MSDYPDDEELTLIKEWPFPKYDELIEYLQSSFWMPDWCITVKGRHVLRVYISTGGWSGNEDRMEALKQNFRFWSSCWRVHRTGGHYEFRIEIRRYREQDKNSPRKKAR